MSTKGRICLEPAEPIRGAADNITMKLGKWVLRGEGDPERCSIWPLLPPSSPGPPAASIHLSIHPSIHPLGIPGDPVTRRCLQRWGCTSKWVPSRHFLRLLLWLISHISPKPEQSEQPGLRGLKQHSKNLRSQEFWEESKPLRFRTGISL